MALVLELYMCGETAEISKLLIGLRLHRADGVKPRAVAIGQERWA